MIIIVCLGGIVNNSLKPDTMHELRHSCNIECFDGNSKNIFQQLSTIDLSTNNVLVIINTFENFEEIKSKFKTVSILLYDYRDDLNRLFRTKESCFDTCLDCVGHTFTTIQEKIIPEYL